MTVPTTRCLRVYAAWVTVIILAGLLGAGADRRPVPLAEDTARTAAAMTSIASLAVGDEVSSPQLDRGSHLTASPIRANLDQFGLAAGRALFVLFGVFLGWRAAHPTLRPSGRTGTCSARGPPVRPAAA